MKTTAILLVLILGLTYYQVKACSCRQGTVEQGFVNADAVLVGRALKKEKLFFTDSTFSSNSPLQVGFARYDFLVTSILKGVLTKDTISIYTGLGNGDCGIIFILGEKYIIYGNEDSYFKNRKGFNLQKSNNAFWTNMCLRTTFFNRQELRGIKKFAKKKKRNHIAKGT